MWKSFGTLGWSAVMGSEVTADGGGLGVGESPLAGAPALVVVEVGERGDSLEEDD